MIRHQGWGMTPMRPRHAAERTAAAENTPDGHSGP